MDQMPLRRPRILFFIDGPVPNEADIKAVAALQNVDVAYRNANGIDPTGNLETCDGVEGAVPPSYQHLPDAAEANKIRDDRQAELKKESRDPLSPSFPNADKNRKGDNGTGSKVWGAQSNETTGAKNAQASKDPASDKQAEKPAFPTPANNGTGAATQPAAK